VNKSINFLNGSVCVEEYCNMLAATLRIFKLFENKVHY